MKDVAAWKPRNIKLEAFVHEEWPQIPVERRQKPVSTILENLLKIKYKGIFT